MIQPARIALVTLGLLGLPVALTQTACLEYDACDEYVSYMCDCHDGEGSVDCDSLQTAYANADAALQDECAVALENQEDQDYEDGHECASDTGETPA